MRVSDQQKQMGKIFFGDKSSGLMSTADALLNSEGAFTALWDNDDLAVPGENLVLKETISRCFDNKLVSGVHITKDLEPFLTVQNLFSKIARRLCHLLTARSHLLVRPATSTTSLA